MNGLFRNKLSCEYMDVSNSSNMVPINVNFESNHAESQKNEAKKSKISFQGLNPDIKIDAQHLSSKKVNYVKKGYIKIKVADVKTKDIFDVLINKKDLKSIGLSSNQLKNSSAAEKGISDLIKGSRYLSAKGHTDADIQMFSKSTHSLKNAVAAEQSNDAFVHLETHAKVKLDGESKKIVNEWIGQIRENPHQVLLGTGLKTTTNKDLQLLIYEGPDHTVHIDKWKGNAMPAEGSKELIAMGGAGVVQKVFNKAAPGGYEVLKTLISNTPPEIKAIHREAAILYKIHELGIREGFQLPPHAVTALNTPIFSEEGEPIHGFIGPAYHGDLSRIGVSAAEGLSVANQLISALVSLDDLELCHSDIKPGNIFFMRDENGKLKCYLADFGAATFYDEAKPGTINEKTPGYYSKMDEALEMASKKNGETKDAYIQRQQARDVLAMGVTLIEVLGGRTTKDPPSSIFNVTEDDWQGPGAFPENGFSENGREAFELIEQRYGQKMVSLLIKMVYFDPAERPSKKECQEALQEIMAK